ncbi:maltotransferase domain-containing protein [Nocardioides sp. TF02-7]|uniref:maltotransferase domain-containing protein n=1 Tax=Nocardioides sp. TF02-7 TaxID=2917724 RepID=UPI0023DCB29B|nr:maltotransferase domain-containing protein [Nocardioides sp. TF02-7]
MVGRIPVIDVMPVLDLGRLPAKATVGEPFPVSATVFREGHDRLGAEAVLIGPDGTRRAPVRMHRLPTTDRFSVDRYEAWVVPDQQGGPGRSRCTPGPTRSAPGSTTPASRSAPTSTWS